MPRLRDSSLRTKLYGLVLGSALVVAAVLGLSSWLLSEFRVNGPVYQKLARKRELLAEVLPPTLVLTQPYTTLNQLIAAGDDQKIRQLEARFQQEAKAYLD